MPLPASCRGPLASGGLSRTLFFFAVVCAASQISLKAYKTLAGAATGEQALGQQLVVRGTSLPVFFAADPKLKLPKGVKPGEVLTGTVTYCKASSSVAGPDKHPDGFPIHYLVAPSAPSAPKSPVRAVPPPYLLTAAHAALTTPPAANPPRSLPLTARRMRKSWRRPSVTCV